MHYNMIHLLSSEYTHLQYYWDDIIDWFPYLDNRKLSTMSIQHIEVITNCDNIRRESDSMDLRVPYWRRQTRHLCTPVPLFFTSFE